jgi:Ca2+-binding RTX toxin-like protein
MTTGARHNPATAKCTMPSASVIEPVECRLLLSAATLSHGLLTVQATDLNSTIVVAVNSSNKRRLSVTVDGTVQTFSKAAVREIVVDGGSGSDYIAIDDSNGPVMTPASLYGGAGDDTIIGGAGPELLEGGDGNNVLTAGSGNQTLQGGAGNDTLTGGPGDDLLEAGDGDDLLTAGSGPNQLYGGAGTDTLYGGSGNDTLGGADQDELQFQGEPAPSSIYAPGRASIVCGSGSDWVVGSEYEQLHQQSTIVAGSGHDILDGRGNDVIVGQKPGDVIPDQDEYGDPSPGQTSFAVDILAVLNIYIKVNGKLQHVAIPDGVGNFDSRGAFYTSVTPIITSDPGGTLLRMRDVVKRQFTLQEFFQNWGISFDSTHIGRYLVGDGNKLTMTVNGQPNTQFGNYVIQSRSRLRPNGSWVNTRVDHITIVYS